MRSSFLLRITVFLLIIFKVKTFCLIKKTVEKSKEDCCAVVSKAPNVNHRCVVLCYLLFLFNVFGEIFFEILYLYLIK